jgi:hypothetical protein
MRTEINKCINAIALYLHNAIKKHAQNFQALKIHPTIAIAQKKKKTALFTSRGLGFAYFLKLP